MSFPGGHKGSLGGWGIRAEAESRGGSKAGAGLLGCPRGVSWGDGGRLKHLGPLSSNLKLTSDLRSGQPACQKPGQVLRGAGQMRSLHL